MIEMTKKSASKHAENPSGEGNVDINFLEMQNQQLIDEILGKGIH